MSSLASDRPSNLRLTAVPSPERSEATPPSRLEQAHAQRQSHLREYSTVSDDIRETESALGADRQALEETQRRIADIRSTIDGAAADLTVVSLPTLTPEQHRDLVAFQETARLQQIRIEARTARLTELEGRCDAIRRSLAQDADRIRRAAVAEQGLALTTALDEMDTAVQSAVDAVIRVSALTGHLSRHDHAHSAVSAVPRRILEAIRRLAEPFIRRDNFDAAVAFPAHRHDTAIRGCQDDLAAELKRLINEE
jgi:chromosome segregation ATPase